MCKYEIDNTTFCPYKENGRCPVYYCEHFINIDVPADIEMAYQIYDVFKRWKPEKECTVKSALDQAFLLYKQRQEIQSWE